MANQTFKFLLASLLLCIGLITGCASNDITSTNETETLNESTRPEETEESVPTTPTTEPPPIIDLSKPFVFPPAEDFNGVKLDENNRLIATAYNKIQTFENGKTPIKEIYVSPDGSDNNDGSISAPYQTFIKAISKAEPGTAVRIMPGTYTTSIYTEKLYGTEENPIWIGGIPGQERPVFDGAGVQIVKGAYIIIHDLEVKDIAGATGTGIHVNDGGDIKWPSETHHFIFRNLYVHDITYQNFKFAGLSYSWIFDCEVSWETLGQSAGLDYVGCHYTTIAYNYFHDLKGVGIQLKGGSFEADIYGNLFINAGARAINMGGSTGEQFFRPYLVKDGTMYEGRYLRAYSNIFIGGGSTFSFVCSTDCYAVNNTVIRPKNQIFRILNEDGGNHLKLGNNGRPHNNTVSNNIFYYGNDLTGEAINISFELTKDDKKSFIMQNNLFYNADNKSASRPYNIGDFKHDGTIAKDPLFEDVLNNNFDLASDSPAAAAGSEYSFVTEDYYGKPFGNPRSIGAIQYK